MSDTRPSAVTWSGDDSKRRSIRTATLPPLKPVAQAPCTESIDSYGRSRNPYVYRVRPNLGVSPRRSVELRPTDGRRAVAVVVERRKHRSVSMLPGASFENRVRAVRHAFGFAGVVESRRMSRAADGGRIDERVRAVAADDPHENALAHVTAHDGCVVAAVQVDQNLVRLVDVEATRVEGRSTGLEANFDVLVAHPANRGDVRGIGPVEPGHARRVVR